MINRVLDLLEINPATVPIIITENNVTRPILPQFTLYKNQDNQK